MPQSGVLIGALAGALALVLAAGGCSVPRTAETNAPETPRASLVYETGFETDEGGFFVRSRTEKLVRTPEAHHSGGYSLRNEGRTASWNGASFKLDPYLKPGNEYTISLWVTLISPGTAALLLTAQIDRDGTLAYQNLDRRDLSSGGGWVEFKGFYHCLDTEKVTIYMEGSPGDASFYIDDLRITQEESKPVMIQDLPPLKTVYQDYFPLGNIISPRDVGERFELLSRHFSIITAENAMKPGELQPAPGVFNWAVADNLVDKALSAGMKVHGHTLAWHQQTGAWMSADGSREEAVERLSTHAKTVVEHFKGRVISWDVVNEVFNDGPGAAADWKACLRDTPWLRLIGPGYIEIVFLAAREAGGPDLKLYYNDYNMDNQNKALAVFNMVKDINGRHPGLIDGIGMQGHYSLNTDPRNVELSIQKFISLGVEVSISELDIIAGSGKKLQPEESRRQAALFADLFTIFKKYRLGRVTFWGLEDGSSWRSDQNPTLFDRDLQAKDAFYAVADPEKFLAEHRPD